jgi:hypothetical protein
MHAAAPLQEQLWLGPVLMQRSPALQVVDPQTHRPAALHEAAPLPPSLH